MKESVTKFDLEAAFKALDEIEIPKAGRGIKANRAPLTEIFSKKTKLESLLEDYYDVNDINDLSDAKDTRDAEIAKAKLARIEKIVDLNAESPEDLLMSYVGKIIVQCPQCMTLFYKDPEDVVEDENDPTTVNVDEACQHCGNESGYTLVGKVGEVTPEEAENYEGAEDLADNEETVEIDVDGTNEESSPEETASEDDIDLDDIELDLEIEDDEANETKEESFNNIYTNQFLTEDLELEESNEDDFDKLLNSEEFKEPISDSEVRAMLAELDEGKENSTVESLSDEDNNVLIEGPFGKLKDVLSKTAKAIDNSLKTREQKADWILTNAMVDGAELVTDDHKKLKVAQDDRRFHKFAVLGFESKYTDGKVITISPFPDNERIIPSMDEPVLYSTYKEADAAAKAWSMRQGHGPAFIYLTKNVDDENAAFLCSYFEGKLDTEKDMLEKYLKSVQKDWEGAKISAKAAADIEKKNAEADNKLFKAGINQNTDEALETTSAEASNEGATQESLSTIVNNLNELHEDTLEKQIASTLVENYSNITGFKLDTCEYFNNKNLKVSGEALLTSGKTKPISFNFTEAYHKDAKIVFEGFNSKFGAKKDFILTGTAKDKIFITESFKNK